MVKIEICEESWKLKKCAICENVNDFQVSKGSQIRILMHVVEV